MPHLVRAPDPDDLAELGQFDLGLLMGGPDESIADMEPSRMFVDVVNPTLEEVRRWAQSGQDEPIEDFEIILAEPANLGFLIELIADQTCPAGDFLLRSLYCAVGHTPRPNPLISAAVVHAERSGEPRLVKWARRVRRVANEPATFSRRDWCGWQATPDRFPD